MTIKLRKVGHEGSRGGRAGTWMVTAAVVALSSIHAAAQENAAVKGGLEEIVVTAQKRGQNLQAVPLSVTAFTPQMLTSAGVSRAAEISQIDPSIQINAGSGVVLPFIRGVGNYSATTVGNESSVPIYIDDVYYSRLSPAYLELNNVERVEVLKGPQGTLFGRNASGGAVQIYTRDPGDKLEMEAKAGVGNYMTTTQKLYVSGPLSDKVGAEISASAQQQNDSYGRNFFTNSRTVGFQNFVNLRAKLVIDASPTTRIRLAGFYVKTKGNIGLYPDRISGTVGGTPSFEFPAGSGQFISIYGPITPQLAAPQSTGFYNSNTNVDLITRHEGKGGSVKIDQELGFAQLVSITAYRAAEEYYAAEGDESPFNWLRYDLHSIDRQLSQELQLKSPVESKIQWIAGLYYLDSKQGFRPTTITGDAITLNGGISQELFGIQTVKSYSGYTQATLPVVDEKTNITLGLRYNKDVVRGVGWANFNTPFGTFPAQTPHDQTVDFYKLTYKVGVDHHFSENIMGYASYSRGYKSGTFNTLPLDSDPNRSEVVSAYEVGVKSELFDNRLRLNLAAFENVIDNPQVQVVIRSSGGTAAFVGLQNGKKARIRGVEWNADMLIAKGLTARFGGTYLDAKYTDFNNSPSFIPLTSPPYGLANSVTIDARGKRLAQVPSWRLVGGLNYDIDTAVGHFNVDLNAAFTGSFFWNPDNIVKQKQVTLMNGGLMYHPPGNEQWSIQFWAKNILQEKYYIGELDVSGGSGNIAAYGIPRTYGVEIGYKL